MSSKINADARELLRFNVPITVENIGEDGSKKLYIKGNAINTGISRNKVNYSEDVLRAAASTLVGKPLLINHADDDVLSIVGKVVEADFDGHNVPFKAEVDQNETKLVSKLEQGFINSVSVGSYIPDDKIETDDEGVLQPKNIEFVELSMIPVPGVPTAGISHVLHEKFMVSRMNDLQKMQEEIQALSKKNEELEKKFAEQEEETPTPAPEPKPEPTPEPEKKPETEDPEKPSESAKELDALKESMKKLTEKFDKMKDSKGIVSVPVNQKREDLRKKEFVRDSNEKVGIDFYPKHPELFY